MTQKALKTIVGSDTFVIQRNVVHNVTMIENTKDRTIFPIDDRYWKEFVQDVVVANKHILRDMEKREEQRI